VAALIIDQARAAQLEARRARIASLGLRVAIRRNNRIARAKTEQAAAAAEAARETGRQARRCGSPWSDLDWRRADDEIDRTLVPLD